MPYVVGDIVRIGTEQIYFNQKLRNAWYMRITAAVNSVTGTEILEQFTTDVLEPVEAIQNDAVSSQRLTIDNVTDGLSFAEYIPNTNGGLRPGAGEPSFTAFQAVYVRGTKITRNGYKRFGGVSEGDTQGNGVNPVLMSTPAWADLETALNQDLVVVGSSGQATLAHIIYGRPNAEYPTGRWQYPTSIVLSEFLTTQVSRKRGRGE